MSPHRRIGLCIVRKVTIPVDRIRPEDCVNFQAARRNAFWVGDLT